MVPRRKVMDFVIDGGMGPGIFEGNDMSGNYHDERLTGLQVAGIDTRSGRMMKVKRLAGREAKQRRRVRQASQVRPVLQRTW